MANSDRDNLLETLLNINQRLQGNSGSNNTDSVALRLEAVVEAALLNGNISLEVCDLINQARQLLQKEFETCDNACEPASSYQAPVAREVGHTGRPKFIISEQQLLFFKGVCACFYRI